MALLTAALLAVMVGVPLGNLFYKAGLLVTQTSEGTRAHLVAGQVRDDDRPRALALAARVRLVAVDR